MKKGLRVLLVVFIVGLMLGIVGLGDTMLMFKGKTVNLTDPISSFSEKALAQGDIDFVYGPFATLEETQKRYGITTSKTETDFFIVGNLEAGEAFVVFSTSNKDLRAELTSASDKWIDWLNSDDENEPAPEVKISFKGKLAKQLTDDDYIKYYDEAKADLENVGITASEYGSMRIISGEVSMVSVVMCFGGFAVALICLLIFIISLVKSKKQASSEEFY